MKVARDKNLNRIGVIVPAYQAGRTIGEVIESLDELGFPRCNIIVVDDGSSDKTYEVAKASGVTVLQHQKNLGKGAALDTGYQHAIRVKLDAVVTLDADKQHLGREIFSFLGFYAQQHPDLLLGNRMNETKDMPFIRWLTNEITSLVVSLLINRRVPDSQCGFRLLATRMLQHVKTRTVHYEAESELIIRAGWLGFKIDSIPIATVYTGGQSYINPLVDTLRFTAMALKHLWR